MSLEDDVGATAGGPPLPPCGRPAPMLWRWDARPPLPPCATAVGERREGEEGEDEEEVEVGDTEEEEE